MKTLITSEETQNLETLKCFVGIKFSNGTTDIVPRSWLFVKRNKTHVKYPSTNVQARAKAEANPKDSWGAYQVKVLVDSRK